MLIDVKPRVIKPPYGSFEIDLGHPLANGLYGGIIFNSGGQPRDIVKGFNSVFTASRPTWKSRMGGYGLFFDMSLTQAVTVPMNPVPTTILGMTWAMGINVATEGGGGGGGRIYTDGVADNTSPQLQWVGSGLGVININDSRSIVNATCTTSGGNITANKDCHICITDDQTSVLSPNMFKAYFNGVSSALTAGSNGAGTLVDPTAYSLGGLASAAARSIDGVMYYFYKYGRILTQNEAMWLRDEPYAFFRPRPAIWYSFTAGQAATASTRPPSLALTGVGI